MHVIDLIVNNSSMHVMHLKKNLIIQNKFSIWWNERLFFGDLYAGLLQTCSHFKSRPFLTINCKLRFISASYQH